MFGRTRQGGRENRNIFENVDVVGELLKTLQYYNKTVRFNLNRLSVNILFLLCAGSEMLCQDLTVARSLHCICRVITRLPQAGREMLKVLKIVQIVITSQYTSYRLL